MATEPTPNPTPTEEPKPLDSLLGDPTPKEGEPTPEPKVEEQPKVEPKAEEEPKPITYTDFTLPEGVELDQERLKSFTDFASEQRLPQEAAQKLLDLHVEELKRVLNEPIVAYQDTQRQWQEEVLADKEIGGDNLASVKATVAKALDQYGDPKVREALQLTGGGNNPAIIRTFYRMAKALTEGGPRSGKPGKGPSNIAQAMYPDLPPE